MFNPFKKSKYSKSALEPSERDVIGLFLNPEQPQHEAILYQLEHTPQVFRDWNSEGYRLTIAMYDDWLTPYYETVESRHLTADLEGQPGELTFYIVINRDGYFQELNIRAEGGEISPKTVWKVDLGDVPPAYVDLVVDERERFAELSTFLGVDEQRLRTWADSSDATIRWNFNPETALTGENPLYDEFSLLVDYVLFENRSVLGGMDEYDVEYEGTDYRFISHSRASENVFLGRDEILVDGTPYPCADFRDFLLKFIFYSVPVE